MAYINFKSDRLLLRTAEEDDAAFVLELLNSPDWIKNIGDRGVKSLSGAKQYIQNRFIEKYKKEGFGMYMVILKESGLPIGQCGLVKRTYLEYPISRSGLCTIASLLDFTIAKLSLDNI